MSTLKYTRELAATRKRIKEDEHQILRDILASHSTKAERIAAWQEQTGKSERAYYRRLKEIDPLTD